MTEEERTDFQPTEQIVQKPKEKSSLTNVIYVLLILAVGLVAFNQYQIMGMTGQTTGGITRTTQAQQISLTGDPVQDAINTIIPTGTPLYGAEMGVSFDDPTGSLTVLVNVYRSISLDDLTPSQLTRFGQVATTPDTACRWCCGIGTRGFGTVEKDSICGCTHNLAFSGLTKYLLQNHENDYTNQDIINEIHKWRGLWFPQQEVAEYLKKQADAGTISADALEGLPGMVGGC